MSESHDPLTSLFKEAAAAGQSRARSAPASFITERGERTRRRRILALAVGACLVFSGAGAAVASLVPDTTGTTVPADSPSPDPSPRISPSPDGPSNSPSAPRTSLPPTSPPGNEPTTSSTSPGTPTRNATYPPS
ncbi:hypothetical protein ACFVFH_10215 [Streptomyces sp. NPDC057697]|uniref:hypothetical protein n=1 Tax=Streptomyces sp. NPDC057697 TaxID=3346219 RepID=UPI003693EEAF